MPTNTPKPRTPYTCLQPVRRGSCPRSGASRIAGRHSPSWPCPEPPPRPPGEPPRCRDRAPRPPHSPPARPRRRRRRYGDPRGPWRAGGTRCRETGGTLSALRRAGPRCPAPGRSGGRKVTGAGKVTGCLCELLSKKPSRVGAAETRSSRPWTGQAAKANPHEGGQGRCCRPPGRQQPSGPDPERCP